MRSTRRASSRRAGAVARVMGPPMEWGEGLAIGSKMIPEPNRWPSRAIMHVDSTRTKAVLSGLVVTVSGGFVAFSIMAADRPWRWGVPVGAAAILVASAGVLALLGTFRT